MTATVYVTEPPGGQHRNVLDPPSSADLIIATGVTTTCIALIAVTLRIFTRTFAIRGMLGWDDYLVIIAMALSIAFCVTTLQLVNLGAGRHLWDVLLSDYSPGFLQVTVAVIETYCSSVSFSKLSILAFYLRLSPERKFRRGVYALITIVVGYTVIYEFLMILRCHPVSSAWDLNDRGTCMSKLVPMMVLGIINIAIDISILLLPVRVVLPLQMPGRQKLSLIFLFMTGGFVCAAAIKRTIILPPLLSSADYTWDVTSQMNWGFIEINAGILCACIPALRPLFKRYLPFILSSKGNNYSKSCQAIDNNFLSTSMKNNRRRRASLGEAFEMQGHTDGRKDDGDEEAILWGMTDTTHTNDKDTAGPTLRTETSKERIGSDGHADLEDAYYACQQTTKTIIEPGQLHSEQHNGINVRRETKIIFSQSRSYDSARPERQGKLSCLREAND